MDKNPQIAEEQLVMTMDKAQETELQDTKVSFSVFSADISKSEEISRWRPIDKTLHYDFSATETFLKNRHNCLSEGLTVNGDPRISMSHAHKIKTTSTRTRTRSHF